MKRRLIPLALAVGLCATPATAEPFTIFVYETPADFALRVDAGADGQAYWAAYARYAEVLKASGAIRGGAPLGMPEAGRVFKAGQGTAGGVKNEGLQLGGYFIVEAPSLEAAAALAAQAPSVIRGGAAEVRSTFPAPTMAP